MIFKGVAMAETWKMMSRAKYENIKGKDQIKIKSNLKIQIIKMCSNLGQKT